MMDQVAPGAALAPGDNGRKRRASARVASSKKRKLVSDRPDDAESSPAIQAKVKRHKWGRVVGRLAGLMEMPMDILFEILGHLMPLDLLRLARTTKQFRQLLMHRSSASIWIAARRNVPSLPDCPPYMSEPQFANLVFDTHCHECLSPHIRLVDWRIGRRICSKCAKGCMVEDYPLFSGDQVYKAVPSKYGKRGRLSYYSKDITEFQLKKASFTDPEERKQFVKERQELVCQMEKHGALLEGWAASQAKDRSEQLEDLRRERKEAIVEKLKALGWGPEIEQIPECDDLALHKLVKQPIRLTQRIWTNIQVEMIEYMEAMKSRRLERERKALVISRKTIAVTILRRYKLEHLPVAEIMPEPVDFCALSQVSDILELPTDTDVTEDTFAPIVEKMDELVGEWRAQILASLVQKVKSSLDAQKPRVSVTSSENKASSSSVCKRKAKAEPLALDDSQVIQKMSLATTVFNCKCCNPQSGIVHGLYGSDFSSDTDASEDDFFDPWDFGFGAPRRPKANPLFFPMVLGHHCLTKQHGFHWEYSGGGDPTKEYDYPVGKRTRWACNLLQVDDKAGKMTANIITTCGLDPETTTVAEMDQTDHQLACLNCVVWSDDEWDKGDAPVYGWRGAVAHNCRTHPSKTDVKWMLIEEDLADEVVDVDEQERADKMILAAMVFPGFDSTPIEPPEELVWLCAHCLDLPNESEPIGFSEMKVHLTSSHSVSEPEENRDYYKDFEALQSRRARIPRLRITLTMDRPNNVPGPGERHPFDLWYPGIMDDEFEDEF